MGAAMRTSSLAQSVAAFVAVVLASAVRAGDVLVLDDKNFSTEGPAARSSETFIIKFYAPWCGHCKKLEPTWETLATEMKEKSTADAKYVVAKVDVTANKALGGDFGVKSFPEIYRVKGDERIKHKGARNIESLSQFALTGEGGMVEGKLGFMEKIMQDALKHLERLGPVQMAAIITGGLMVLLLVGFIVGYLTKKHEIIPIDLQCADKEPTMKLGLMVLDSKYTSKTAAEVGSTASAKSHFYTQKNAGDKQVIGKSCFEIPARMQFVYNEPEKEAKKEK